MLIDHVGATIMESLVLQTFPVLRSTENINAWLSIPGNNALFVSMQVMRCVGRLAFPLFAFLLVEGFLHTKNVLKYTLNLAIFAIISEIPFNLCARHKVFANDYQNVYFTLLFSLLCLYAISELAEKRTWPSKLAFLSYPVGGLALASLAYITYQKYLYAYISFTQMDFILIGILGIAVTIIVERNKDANWKNRFTFTLIPIVACCMITYFLKADYAVVGIFVVTIIYLFRSYKTIAFAAGCIFLGLISQREFFALAAIPLVYLYNGERGMKINKYIFYGFYPVHLAILALICYLTQISSFTIK